MNRPVSLHIDGDTPFDTLAGLELSSIARGYEALDATLKKAPVRVLLAAPASPGKFAILFTGEVEEAARSLAAGVAAAEEALLDEILLPHAHPRLVERMQRTAPAPEPGGNGELPALGALETYHAPTLLGAADTALKTGETHLLEVHLLAGIGGKATALLAGDVESVREAIGAGAAFARSRDALAAEVIIPRPDPQMVHHVGARRGATR